MDMSFTIKTTVAEQYLRNKWNTVGTFDTLPEAIDEISSPSFTLYDLMIVKVLKKSTIVFMGVQSNGEWINVGRDAALFTELASDIEYAKTYASILTLWKDHFDPRSLISMLKIILPESVYQDKESHFGLIVNAYKYAGGDAIMAVQEGDRFSRASIMQYTDMVRASVPFTLFLKSLCDYARK